MKQFARKYKGFTYAVIAEVIFLLCLVAASFGRINHIQLPAEQLVVSDGNAVLEDYRPKDSMMLNTNTLVVYDNKENKDTVKSLYVSGRNDAEPYGRWIAGSGPLTVTPGMYELEVKYYSLVYDNENGGNSDDQAGAIQIVSENNQQKISYNEIPLRDGITVNSTRVWVRSLKSLDDVEIKINFYGVGDLKIDSITLKELPGYRFLTVLAWLILFLIIDVCYLYFFTDNQFENKSTTAGLIVIMIFASLPMFTDFLLKGHDMDFHVARIWALAENIKAGQWAFPIQTEMANGYGYASPLFYGQIFFYIPAIIYLIGAPIQACYQIYVIGINIATVLISYSCFKGITNDRKTGLLGSFLYTLAAYRIANVYLRSAAGEYTAMMFYPLIIYGFIRIYQKEASKVNWKDCILVVIGLTGLIQSHILSCELAAIFILLFCILFIKKTFELKRLIALVGTVLATLGLNLAFIVPFLCSMGMHIRVREQETEAIQHYGTYLLQVLGVFMTSSGDTVPGMANEMPMALGFALVLGIGLFLWCCMQKYQWKQEKDVRFKVGTVCVAFTVICIVLSTRFFPWDSIEEISPLLAKLLSVVQFPWRYLSIASVFATTATVIAVRFLAEHKSVSVTRVVTAGFIGLTLVCCGSFYMNFADTAAEYKVYGGADVEQDTVGGEYMITGTIEGYMRWRSVITDLSCVGIAGYESDHGTVTMICSNVSDTEQLVQIPIQNYDNYHAYTDDGTELTIQNGTNNRLGVMVPTGYNGTVRVAYEVPLLWKISYVISALVLIGIVVGAVFDSKRKKTAHH